MRASRASIRLYTGFDRFRIFEDDVQGLEEKDHWKFEIEKKGNLKIIIGDNKGNEVGKFGYKFHACRDRVGGRGRRRRKWRGRLGKGEVSRKIC